jgi:lipopolysaccharide export LptBFGC system permease protein LptF
LYIITISFFIFIFFIFVLQIRTNNIKYPSILNKKINLRKNIKKNNSFTTQPEIDKKQNDYIDDTEKIKIIDDIKNIDTPPLEESLKSLKNEILQKNATKK